MTLSIGNLLNYSLVFVIDVSLGPKAHQLGQADWHKDPPVCLPSTRIAGLFMWAPGSKFILPIYIGIDFTDRSADQVGLELTAILLPQALENWNGRLGLGL